MTGDEPGCEAIWKERQRHVMEKHFEKNISDGSWHVFNLHGKVVTK
jgi:hypothetical protein